MASPIIAVLDPLSTISTVRRYWPRAVDARCRAWWRLVISVVLAEGHRLVLEGMRCLLEMERDIRVVGETSDGLAVAGLVRRRKPRVLVVPLAMPGLNGMELIRQVRRATPETAVIVLTMYGDERYVVEALRTGASAYVLKQARGVELAQAIRRVVAGRYYLSRPLSERSIQEWLRRVNDGGVQDYTALTAREREVLHLVVHGYKTASVAKRLSISPRTAEAHRARVMRKLGLHTYVDLFAYALAHGILTLPGDPPVTVGGTGHDHRVGAAVPDRGHERVAVMREPRMPRGDRHRAH